jgi:hypothetical protein
MRATALACSSQHTSVGAKQEQHTEVFVLDVSAWFAFGLDHIMGLLCQVSYEDLL